MVDFRSLLVACDFYLVRHGESEANSRGAIQGHSDSPLSEKGRSHAAAAGAQLAEWGVDLVYASPLARAADTGRAIAAACGAPEPELEDDLKELQTGIFTDLSLEEAAERYPKVMRAFRVHSWESVPGAERVSSLRARALRHWERMILRANEMAGQTGGRPRIVSVAHGGILQWLIKATGTGSPRWMPIFALDNCGICHLHVAPVQPDRDAGRAESYFAEWRRMNFIPYSR